MTETRTTSATGGQKGVKAQRHSLIPRDGLDVIAEVFGFGAKKYDDHNWRKGYEWSKSYDALQRHLTAWWDGEDIDPESGLSHLGHAGFHILVLATWEREAGAEGSSYDDRYKRPAPEPILDAEYWRRVVPLDNSVLPCVVWGDPALHTQSMVESFHAAFKADVARLAEATGVPADLIAPDDDDTDGVQRSFDRR